MLDSIAVKPLFTTAIVEDAICKLKNNKAAFPTMWKPELLKYFSAPDENKDFLTCLSELFNTFALRGIPLVWN